MNAMNAQKNGATRIGAWVTALILLFGVGCFARTVRAAQKTGKTENVILITLDGVRSEELFGGLDREALQSVTKKGAVEATTAYKKYWAATPEERRAKVMPFFWNVLMKRHGSVAGDRSRGSIVQITNRHRFSYPGYSEILTGQPHDDVIDSNDNKRNPYPTVLEFLQRKLRLDKNQVAAFGSWETINWIDQHEAGSFLTNAGFEAYQHPDPAVRQLSELQFETDNSWDAVRHDVYTFRFALAHLKTHRPRVLYIAFGETDDWAHEGRYDRVLEALERTDKYVRELWEYLQSDERYRDKTTILITTDHGRGRSADADWRNHGEKTEGAQYIWLAAVSPDSALRGEWSKAATIYQNQIAATVCQFLGIDYREHNSQAGRSISQLFAK